MTLNFVLSIVFGGVVTIMSFVMGGEAFNMLGTEEFKGIGSAWAIDQLVPAYAMMVLVSYGVFTTIFARHREKPTA